MEYTKLGRTGLDVSRICLGWMSYGGGNQGNHAWSLSEEESRPFIKKALEAGINFFDTANRYSLGDSEEILGRAIKDFARREEVVIATKVYAGCAQDRMARACRARRSSPRSTTACAGSAWITSTSTRSTVSTTGRRSRRRWKRCMT
jgi:aryl-alcohol dehydrogenase-like predicted oxidoreductase